MKIIKLLILTFAVSLNVVFAQENSENDPDSLRLEGPYLGQDPPGSTAEVFAPGIVSTDLHELFNAFTPEMKEFYFVRYDKDDKPSMIVYKSQNNQWHKSITGPRVGEPFISPDGRTMHLGRRYMERTDTGWSEIKSLGAPFKDISIMRLTASSKGTYYFDEAGEDPIRYSRLIDGKREEPKTLNIDLGKANAHPFIAPDESYLIWDDKREEGYGKADIYISFRQQDGSWGPAINMGDKINSDQSDFYATVTPDGKYIFFNRVIDDNKDIYWVDAQIIESLRAKYSVNESKPRHLKDPYLGQKSPGIVAEPFAPDILSKKGWELDKKGWELKGMFAPGMKEFYFTSSSEVPFLPTVIVFRKEKNNWKKYDFYPYGNDDNILYSGKKYIERTDSGWSEIKSLGPMFDREDWGIMRLSVSDKGTYVFDDYKNNDVIRISRIKDGKREEPKLLGKEINTGKWTAHPFIAPDESYLIWDSEREGGYGDSDLYISFRQKDGSWGAAINLGDKINTALIENGARVTPDGKYIFFGRSEEKIGEDGSTYWVGKCYWVDAQVIENLRPKQ